MASLRDDEPVNTNFERIRVLLPVPQGPKRKKDELGVLMERV